MDLWSVRWRERHEEQVTLDEIERLPVRERPAVVLPVRSTPQQAQTELRQLAQVFPGIIISFAGLPPDSPYARDVSRYSRQGFAIPDHQGRSLSVRFHVAASGTWRSREATRTLTLVHSTIGYGGVIEQPFPVDATSRVIDGEGTIAQLWRDVIGMYRRNGMRVYADAATLDPELARGLARIVDGVILDPAQDPHAQEGIPAWWRGTVSADAGTFKKRT